MPVLRVKVPADLSCTGEESWKEANIDFGVYDLVEALQSAGIDMRGSCDGHGKREGEIHLQDGRILIILPSSEEYLSALRLDSPTFWDAWSRANQIFAPESVQPIRRCSRCNSPREGLNCWKCGNETFVPDRQWPEPKLPLVEPIRAAAREVGYAIGEHGSRERDLDLIAVPWTELAVHPEDLVAHLCERCGLTQVGNIVSKPLGRLAVNLSPNGWFTLIDLSICPVGPAVQIE